MSASDKLIQRVLADPSQYPDEMKRWVAQQVQNDQTIQFSPSQIAGLGVSQQGVDARGLAEGCFGAYRSAALTLTNGAWTKFACDAEQFDVSEWHDAVTNKGRYTPLRKGYYRLSAIVSSGEAWPDQKQMIVTLYKNGTRFLDLGQGFVSGSDFIAVGGSGLVLANGTTDYYEVFVYQNTGADKTVGTNPAYSHFQGEFIGRAS